MIGQYVPATMQIIIGSLIRKIAKTLNQSIINGTVCVIICDPPFTWFEVYPTTIYSEKFVLLSMNLIYPYFFVSVLKLILLNFGFSTELTNEFMLQEDMEGLLHK